MNQSSLSTLYNKRLSDMIGGFLDELEVRKSAGLFQKMKAKDLLTCSYIIVQMHKAINQTATKETPTKDSRYKAVEDQLLKAASGEGAGVQELVDAIKVLPDEENVY